MLTSNLSAEHLQDEAAALAYLEASLWPNGPVCAHCGATERIYTLKGKSTRPGVRKCGRCKKPFTVMIGTIFERSHVPMTKWLQAICLLTSSKKGISSRQLHRILNVTYETAWFMSHRIREAMRDGTLGLLGGEGKVIEADETYHARRTLPRSGRSRGSAARRASAPSQRWSSVAVRRAPSTLRVPMRTPCAASCERTPTSEAS
jgi:transposase-like protein